MLNDLNEELVPKRLFAFAFCHSFLCVIKTFQKRLIAFFNAFMPFLPQIPDPFVLLSPFFVHTAEAREVQEEGEKDELKWNKKFTGDDFGATASAEHKADTDYKAYTYTMTTQEYSVSTHFVSIVPAQPTLQFVLYHINYHMTDSAPLAAVTCMHCAVQSTHTLRVCAPCQTLPFVRLMKS